jgi:sialate O-acetylesterase
MNNIFALLITFTLMTSAEVKFNSLFTDNMVLQRDKALPIWGTASPNQKITITFAGQSQTVTADASGEWHTSLHKLKASTENRTLTLISGNEQISIANVLVGDIWICTGQSNMHGELRTYSSSSERGGGSRAGEFKKIIEQSTNYPTIRLMALNPETANTPQTQIKPLKQYKNSWQLSNKSAASYFSAVGYIFGRELNTKHNIPIGLIAAARGATPIQSWMSEEVQAKFSQKVNKSTYYNAMIHPLQKMAFKGIIWYQGENNSRGEKSCELYKDLFKEHISSWRKQWNQGDFPFLFVQLAGYNEQTKFDTDVNWPIIRESQAAALDLANTGMVVATDLGHTSNIHPYAKVDLAKRLAAEAGRLAYGEKSNSMGPMFDSMQISGNTVRVSLKNVGEGLRPQAINLATKKVSADSVKGFLICGTDKNFVHAEVKIESNTVILSSPNVKAPVEVRYAWAGFPDANLYNSEGFPLVPFRTDSFKAFEATSPYVKWGPSNDGINRVLCFGDSITRGTYIDGKYRGGNSWVNIFDKLSGETVKAINAGRSGRKTADYKEFDSTVTKYRSIDHVIFFLAVNDLRVASDKVLQDCLVNMKAMIDQARACYSDELKVTIIGSAGLSIGNVSERFHKMGYDEKEQAMLDKLRPEYKKLAKENNAAFVDLWNVVSKDNYSDGLHPNLDGQQQIAAAIWKQFTRLQSPEEKSQLKSD